MPKGMKRFIEYTCRNCKTEFEIDRENDRETWRVINRGTVDKYTDYLNEIMRRFENLKYDMKRDMVTLNKNQLVIRDCLRRSGRRFHRRRTAI